MSKLIFSQSGIYRLQQLASQVHNVTGTRHKLSDEAAMIQMLQDCASSTDRTIQTYFAAFTSELQPDQVNSLVARGIRPLELEQTH